MKKYLSLLSLCVIPAFFSCSGNKEKDTKHDHDSTKVVTDERPVTKARDSLKVPGVIAPDGIFDLDLAQNLDGKSVQELRLLRNAIYARHGYLFDQADLRGYFSANTKWYDSLSENEYFRNEDNPNQVKLTGEEEKFVDRVKEKENELKKKNYILNNGVKLANVENIVNLFQYKELDPEFLKMLDKNNFVIVPGANLQLFHVYEENDYHQVPNFITTDAFLQMYHMYFSYLLRSLEEQKFIPALIDLTEGLQSASLKIAATGDAKVKETAERNEVFYAIPHDILDGPGGPVLAKNKTFYSDEMKKIKDEQDNTSEYMEYTNQNFSYSLFRPRGHYTRSEKLKKYFKAMMWLQTAVYCRENPKQLERISLTAWLLSSGKTSSGKTLMQLYNSVYEPICFLMGEPDNISVTDIIDFIHKNTISSAADLLNSANQSKLSNYLAQVVKSKNHIKNKLEESCQDKVNFMPQRYLPDNKVLQELVDLTPNSNRPFPKGLDVLAVMGASSAEDLLYHVYKEQDNWKDYQENMNKLRQEFSTYNNWDKTVYNKWLQSLNVMQQPDTSYPVFMQTQMWDRKNLNTALASWSELKHDAILYGEQPNAAECGSGGPPPPYTIGYVEPNVRFWNNMMELMDLTENLMKKNDLLTDDLKEKSERLKTNCQFLLTASQKELKHQKLSRQEYDAIEVMGATIEYITLSIIDPDKSFQTWENVQGPDKSISVVADVYTRNILGDNKSGVLHEGVGKVNDIYVVIEVDGYLYLAKGATFSYYEFVEKVGTRLTDEEWQKKLEDHEVPPIPEWMQDIIYQNGKVPAADEKISYSSGC